MHDTQQLGDSLYEVTLTKGQIISEQICGVLKFSKKATNIVRISALASKMGQIIKIKAIF